MDRIGGQSEQSEHLEPATWRSDKANTPPIGVFALSAMA